jgi:hypothetical protein
LIPDAVSERVYGKGVGRGKGDWLRVFEVPVHFAGAHGFDVRSAEDGDRQLEDSEPVPVLGSAQPSRTLSESEGWMSRPRRIRGMMSRHSGYPRTAW